MDGKLSLAMFRETYDLMYVGSEISLYFDWDPTTEYMIIKYGPESATLQRCERPYGHREIEFSGPHEPWHAEMPDCVCLERDWEHVVRVDLYNMIVRNDAVLEEAGGFFDSWHHSSATGGQREGTPR